MRSLFPMLLKFHQHLHPIVESKIAKQNIDVDINLNIFEMSITYNEPVRKPVNMELLFFKHYHVDSKEIKCPLEWWEKHESLFPIVGFLARQILGIPKSQVETKHIFSLARFLTNLKRCHLQCDNLEILTFVTKNWHDDDRVDYRRLSNLVELIEIDMKLKEELEKFDEIVNM